LHIGLTRETDTVGVYVSTRVRAWRNTQTEQGDRGIQIDETRLANVGGDEFGGELDGGEEEREVACCGSTEAELLAQDVSEEDDKLSPSVGSSGGTDRVRVMRSVFGCSSPDMAERESGRRDGERGEGETGRAQEGI